MEGWCGYAGAMGDRTIDAESTPLGAFGIILQSERFPAGILGPGTDASVPWNLAFEEIWTPAGLTGSPSAERVSGARPIDLDGAHATVPLATGSMAIDGATRTAVITHEGPLDAEMLVHPQLAALGTVAAHWSGRVALHAGAVVIGGRAWAILAGRSHGKSTTLASFDAAGDQVLTDDLLVVDEHGSAFAGPRCVDLRAETAALFPAAREIASVSGRERFRLRTRPAPSSAPLAGFLQLGWAELAGTMPVPAAHRLPLLAGALTLNGVRPNMRLLLELAGLPMLIVHRPQRLDALDATLELIRSVDDASR